MRRFRRIISQILALIGVFIATTDTLQVDLLDSTSLESLEWTTYSNGGSGVNRRGWREASYTDSEGDVFRVYTVCNVATDSVDNWLRTPFIRRGDANRLYIELKFSMRSCTKYPNPGRLHQCKESFKLLYYEADSDIANSMMPTWDDDTYRHIDVIAADQVFASASDIVINIETRSISLSSSGVYFAFHDHGACATLLSVRIYYVICPTTTLNYAFFPNATTGSELSSIIRVTGQCVDHAVKDQTVSYLCKADGNWYYLTGTCHCLPGFEPGKNSDSVNGNDVECTECARHTYKWQTGSMACQPCPPYSEAAEPGSLDCSCIDGYFRSSTDSKAAPCTRPPSRVQNLTAVRVGQSSVNLSWHHPIDSGGRWDLQYRVECSNCGNRVVYAPSKTHLNSTRVYLSGLNSNTRYKITVYAENGVSQLSGVESTSNIVIITEPADATRITNVRIVVVGGDYISLAWDLPSNPDIDAYEVRCSKVSDQPENVTSVVVTTNNFTFFGLDHQTRYSFMVRGRTKKGWGEFSDVVYETTAHLSQLHQTDAQFGIIAGSFAGFILCLAVIIILVVLFLRRNSRDCNRKVNCNQFQNAAATIPLFNAHAHGSFRAYVDPHTYEDPSEAVREFTKEIDVSCITIEAVIGGGEFGDVCRGRLRISPSDELMVAIKTLKTGSLDKNRLDFLTEASIIGQFDDPNVIYLEGVVTRTNPIMIVTEFMENGSLDRFLRQNDGCFTIFQLIGMIRGIASGMRHLSEMGYVHRDLAARNVLVNSSLICKVADFGLSREMETYESDGAYTVKGGKIPIRWTAPEAISYRKFTSASDVWSYGIVTWEVMSYGERPYWSWSNRDVINAIENNFRLPPPMDCPESVYELMLNCWQKDRSFRPKFAELVQSIDRLIRTPDLLRQMAMPRSGDFCESTQTEELTDVDFDVSVEEWLVNLKMDRYTEDFHRNGFTNLMKVANISLRDLVEMGISLVGHQKKIINEAQLLRSKLIGSFSGTTNVNI